MTSSPTPDRRPARLLVYLGVVLVTAACTFLLTALLMNIFERKQEGREHFVQLVELDEDTLDPEVWGRNFPRQYDSYKRTVDTERTAFGGSEAFQHLDDDPVWRRIFAGYGFALDYREDRGHAYMLSDQRETERVTKLKHLGRTAQQCVKDESAATMLYEELQAALVDFDPSPESVGRELKDLDTVVDDLKKKTS